MLCSGFEASGLQLGLFFANAGSVCFKGLGSRSGLPVIPFLEPGKAIGQDKASKRLMCHVAEFAIKVGFVRV